MDEENEKILLYLSRSQVKGLEDKVERSNYNYSKLKKKERKESYSIVVGNLVALVPDV